MNTLPKTQFSIYKIDCKEVETILKTKNKLDNLQNADNIISSLINSIKNAIKTRKIKPIFFEVKYEDFRGLFFKTNHKPAWAEFAQLIFINNELESEKKRR